MKTTVIQRLSNTKNDNYSVYIEHIRYIMDYVSSFAHIILLVLPLSHSSEKKKKTRINEILHTAVYHKLRCVLSNKIYRYSRRIKTKAFEIKVFPFDCMIRICLSQRNLIRKVFDAMHSTFSKHQNA